MRGGFVCVFFSAVGGGGGVGLGFGSVGIVFLGFFFFVYFSAAWLLPLSIYVSA